MPQRTNAFQRIVTLLHASLAGKATVVESEMLTDKVTKEKREVDVLITTNAANYKVVIGIEVVSWGRPAGTPWVEKMRAKHDNLETDKLILVSESGFTKPALDKARFYDIETLTVEKACATDWPLLASLESTGVFEVTTLKYDCVIACTFDDGTKEQIEVPLNATFPSDGRQLTLDEFVRKLLDQAEFRDALYPHIKGAGEHDFWLAYTNGANGLWRIEHKGRSGQVQELRIGLKVVRSESTVSITGGKFQEAAFFAGISTNGSEPLQFVLTKHLDKAIGGYLVDKEGTRTLSFSKRNR